MHKFSGDSETSSEIFVGVVFHIIIFIHKHICLHFTHWLISSLKLSINEQRIQNIPLGGTLGRFHDEISIQKRRRNVCPWVHIAR